MATAKKSAPKKSSSKKATAKPKGKGGSRENAGASQLIPNKVRKTIDIPEDIADLISGVSDASSYMRKATYNQMVKDRLITRKYADQLINWKKK